jgi:hypothetical protein
MTAADVWVAKDDGSDIVRASAIIGVGRDYNGDITARLADAGQAVVTLVATDSQQGSHTPDDLHLRLLRIIARLSDTAEPAIVRPAYEEPDGWTWQVGGL